MENDLLDDMKKLSSAEFEELVYRLGLPPELLVRNSSQVEKSIQIIYYMSQKPKGIRAMEEMLFRIHNNMSAEEYYHYRFKKLSYNLIFRFASVLFIIGFTSVILMKMIGSDKGESDYSPPTEVSSVREGFVVSSVEIHNDAHTLESNDSKFKNRDMTSSYPSNFSKPWGGQELENKTDKKNILDTEKSIWGCNLNTWDACLNIYSESKRIDTPRGFILYKNVPSLYSEHEVRDEYYIEKVVAETKTDEGVFYMTEYSFNRYSARKMPYYFCYKR